MQWEGWGEGARSRKVEYERAQEASPDEDDVCNKNYATRKLRAAEIYTGII